MKTKILLWVIALLLTINLALAVGLRPAKTQLHTEGEEIQYSGEFWVVNFEQKEFTATVYVEGEISRYVQVEQKEVSFREDEDALPLNFKVVIPKGTLLSPGISTANIVVEEKVPSNQANVISSIVVVKHKILVEGPYPDKYIVAKLNFQDQGNSIDFVSEVENLGKEDLTKVKTTFYVNDQKQNPVTKETETTSLKKSENKLLKSSVDKSFFELGEFEVSAVTTYDDQKVEIIQKLVVGKPGVDITYFDPYFFANKINKYTMDLLNLWNADIKNVYVDVDVKKDNQKIDQFRTKSVDLPGKMSQRLQDYFDARNKNPGEYTFDMNVNFWNNYRMETKTFRSELLTDDEYQQIEAALPNMAGAATGQRGDPAYKIIVWIMVGIFIALILVYIFWRYNHREEYE